MADRRHTQDTTGSPDQQRASVDVECALRHISKVLGYAQISRWRELERTAEKVVLRATIEGAETILKLHLSLQRQQIERAFCLQAAAADQGLAPRPLLLGGAQYITVEGFGVSLEVDCGEVWCSAPLHSETEVFELGRLVGRIHGTLAQCEIAGESSWLRWPIAPHASKLSEWSKKRPAIGGAMEMLSGISVKDIDSFCQAPRQWIHGDLWLRNIHGQPGCGQQLQAIDWDHVSWFPVGYEFARAFFASVDIELPILVLRNLLAAYVKGYFCEERRPDDEWRWALLLYHWVGVSDIIYRSESSERLDAYSRISLGRQLRVRELLA